MNLVALTSFTEFVFHVIGEVITDAKEIEAIRHSPNAKHVVQVEDFAAAADKKKKNVPEPTPVQTDDHNPDGVR